MAPANLRYIALHAIGAAVFVFALNYFILGSGLESGVLWGVTFGVMAGALAWHQTKR